MIERPSRPASSIGRTDREIVTMSVRIVLAALVAALLPLLPAGALADKVKVHWLGHATVKITSVEGKVIVIDPFLVRNSKTPERYKSLEALGKVDLILVTHAHYDHIADAPALAKMHNAPVWGPPGLAQSFVALGMLPGELAPRMNKGGTVTPLGPKIKFTMTRAEHSSELVWKNPATGKDEIHVGGEPVGWIVELENGFKIYHAGDTGLFADMRFIGEYYKPDLALLPIGGHFVMSPVDAAYATNTYLKPKFALPIHYGTFPPLKGTPAEYQAALGQTATKVFPIDPGVELTF